MKDNPIYHLGLSTGKDSSALLLWAIHESGLPRDRLRVTFCDTGNEDPLTYKHLAYLESQVIEPAGIVGGCETLIPKLQFFDLAFKKKRFPSRKAQFCSVELKIEPTKAWLRQRWEEGEEVVLLNGKRSGESNQRKLSMKDKPARGFSDYWGAEEWSPLREWTLQQVLAIHRKYKIELNPLYALGARRVGCWPCINCGKHEIRIVAEHRPEKIAEIEAQERRHLEGLGRVSTFFHGKTTTKNFHDLIYTDSDGKKWGTASIRSVVQWSHTERGGRQLRLPLQEANACHLGYLACE